MLTRKRRHPNTSGTRKGAIGVLEAQESATQKGGSMKVCIDPGHGGYDEGAAHRGLQEKCVTLEYADKISAHLEYVYCGYDTVMTRMNDLYVPLSDRVFIANDSDCDLFVSIHCNSCEKPNTATGMEVFYCEGSAKGKEFAEAINDCWTQIPKRGVKPANFTVLTKTNMPAVLIELGFINHDFDWANMQNIFWAGEAIENICEGIHLYATK